MVETPNEGREGLAGEFELFVHYDELAGVERHLPLATAMVSSFWIHVHLVEKVLQEDAVRFVVFHKMEALKEQDEEVGLQIIVEFVNLPLHSKQSGRNKLPSAL